MAEILAAGMTGLLLSRNVKPLKSPQGKLHDLGQYFILIDPGASDAFYDRLGTLIEAACSDPAKRMLVQRKTSAGPVEVVPSVWQRLIELAGD